MRSAVLTRRPGAIRGFHVPLREVRRVRCLLSTGRPWTTRTQTSTFLPPPTPFGSSVSATFACLQLRSLPQIQISSPYRLSSTHPAVVTRRVRLSRFIPRTNCASLHCSGSSLFMPVDSPGGTGGFLRFRGNNFLRATSCRTMLVVIALEVCEFSLQVSRTPE